MTRCAEWLAAALAKAGADRTEVFPTEGNPVVYAEKIVDPKAKTVLVYGHYDVMPVDPRGEWRTEPFEPVIKDGRIWGRGADDDKGQLVDARQGIRGDVRHGEPALQREIHARRRGGDRLAEPLQVLRTEQKNAQGGYNIGVGHLDDLDADSVDHLRPARAGLYGGRGDGPRQRPPLGAVRRRRGQPGQRVDAPRWHSSWTRTAA